MVTLSFVVAGSAGVGMIFAQPMCPAVVHGGDANVNAASSICRH